MAWKTYPAELLDPKIPDEGPYLARVHKVKEGETKDGSEMFSLHFIDHQTGEDLCWDNLVLSDKGLPFALRKLKELGAATINEKGELELCHPVEMEGMTVYLTLVHDEYQGQKKAVPEFASSNHGYRSVEKGEPAVEPGGFVRQPPPAPAAGGSKQEISDEDLAEIF